MEGVSAALYLPVESNPCYYFSIKYLSSFENESASFPFIIHHILL